MLCYVMLCYVILCYVMLYLFILCPSNAVHIFPMAECLVPHAPMQAALCQQCSSSADRLKVCPLSSSRFALHQVQASIPLQWKIGQTHVAGMIVCCTIVRFKCLEGLDRLKLSVPLVDEELFDAQKSVVSAEEPIMLCYCQHYCVMGCSPFPAQSKANQVLLSAPVSGAVLLNMQ